MRQLDIYARIPVEFPTGLPVHIVRTSEEITFLEKVLYGSKIVGVDTETVGCNPQITHPMRTAQVFSMQFYSDEESQPFFVPLWGKYRGTIIALKSWLEDETRRKVLHNAKFDMHVLANVGIKMKGLLADTLVMSFLYDQNAISHGLKACAKNYLGEEAVSFENTFREFIGDNGFKTGSILQDVIRTTAGVKSLIDYSVHDSVWTVGVYKYLKGRLEAIKWGKSNYLDYYEQFERPFTEVLLDVERNGVLVDREKLEEFAIEVGKQQSAEDSRIREGFVTLGVPQIVAARFNIRSHKEVSAILENYLGISFTDVNDMGNYSLSKEVLEGIEVSGGKKDIIDSLLEWRKLEKLRSTYVEPMLSLNEVFQGRMHTTYRQVGTRTMRLSSSNPNLQNIPTGNISDRKFREVFVPPTGMVIGDIDLNQIELRLAAHFSSDPNMVNAFNKGWDLHALTALNINPAIRNWVGSREINNVLLGEVKSNFKKERSLAKTLNFGTVYGMGYTTFAERTGVSKEEAKSLMVAFSNTYSGLTRFIPSTVTSCRKTGYVRTLLGRYLHIPNLDSESRGEREEANRKCFNYMIQGSAADMMKMSMLLIHQDEYLRSAGVKMLLQVHDELVFEVPEGVEDLVKVIIEKYVSRPYEFFFKRNLRVETPAEMGFGVSWADAKL